MNAAHLVVERGETVNRRYIGFCGGPISGRGNYCPWQNEPQPSGEQAERLVVEHYRTEHPREYAAVSSGALNGKLVAEPIVSRVDLDEEDD